MTRVSDIAAMRESVLIDQECAVAGCYVFGNVHSQTATLVHSAACPKAPRMTVATPGASSEPLTAHVPRGTMSPAPEGPTAVDAPQRPSRHDTLAEICRQLLRTIGDDPTRPGLRDTPRRFAAMWEEFIDYDAGRTDTTFPTAEHISSDVVILAGIRVWSMCEHHLVPFWCDVAVAYVPNGAILGLSKFVRIARKHAHRLQVQEQLTADILSEVKAVTGSEDVLVHAEGEHLCMSMRGVRSPAIAANYCASGLFQRDRERRAEVFALAGVAKRRAL